MVKGLKEKVMASNTILDMIKCNNLKRADIVYVNYVMSKLKEISEDIVVCEKATTLDSLVKMSLDDLCLFGDDIVTKAVVAHSKAPMRDGKFYYDLFNVVIKLRGNKGVVTRLDLPMYLSEEKRVFLSHEFIHMVKEQNVNEYILKTTLGDVIPFFFELVMADRDYALKKYIYKVRIKELKYIAVLYKQGLEDFKHNKSAKDLYRFRLSMIAQYLNSFYYAVILYHLYKERSDYVLDYVSRVLRQEMTTLELLEKLNIYLFNNNEAFDMEFDDIKRLFKKRDK